MDEPTSVEVTVSAPAEVVWRWLRDPDLLEQWHGWQAPGLAGEIRQTFLDGAVEDAAARRLVLEGGDTVVVLPQGDRSMVRMVRGSRTPQEGAEGEPSDDRDDPTQDAEAPDDEVTEAWRTFLQQLRFAVERHPADRRRTLHLDGASTGAGPVAEELHLDDLSSAPGASRYDEHVVGERLHGRVWFSSATQLGLVVDAWGDGLLVLRHRPASAGEPHGGATAVLSTYGLPDADFADLQAALAAVVGAAVRRRRPAVVPVSPRRRCRPPRPRRAGPNPAAGVAPAGRAVGSARRAAARPGCRRACPPRRAAG